MRLFIFELTIVLQVFLYRVNSSETVDEIKQLVGKLAPEDRLSSSISAPCLCEKNDQSVLRHALARGHHRSSHTVGRNSLHDPVMSKIEARERKERLDDAMARFMQIMTFFGHVDNYLTQKTSGFLKVMGKAVELNDYDDEEDYVQHHQFRMRTEPKITTTTSTE